MTREQLAAYRAGAPFHELVNGGESYQPLLKIVEPHQHARRRNDMKDLMNLSGKDLAVTGLKLLVAKQIGPKCTYCEKAASDVFVDKIVGDIFRIEIIPICEKCREVVGNGY